MPAHVNRASRTLPAAPDAGHFDRAYQHPLWSTPSRPILPPAPPLPHPPHIEALRIETRCGAFNTARASRTTAVKPQVSGETFRHPADTDQTSASPAAANARCLRNPRNDSVMFFQQAQRALRAKEAAWEVASRSRISPWMDCSKTLTSDAEWHGKTLPQSAANQRSVSPLESRSLASWCSSRTLNGKA